MPLAPVGFEVFVKFVVLRVFLLNLTTSQSPVKTKVGNTE